MKKYAYCSTSVCPRCAENIKAAPCSGLVKHFGTSLWWWQGGDAGEAVCCRSHRVCSWKLMTCCCVSDCTNTLTSFSIILSLTVSCWPEVGCSLIMNFDFQVILFVSKLLDFEARSGEQVPLLLKMKRSQLALSKAVESGDTDLGESVSPTHHLSVRS